jgi:hypothetical protein
MGEGSLGVVLGGNGRAAKIAVNSETNHARHAGSLAVVLGPVLGVGAEQLDGLLG